MVTKPTFLDILPLSILIVAIFLVFSPSGPLPAWQQRILAKPPQLANFGEFQFKLPTSYTLGTTYISNESGIQADVRVVETDNIPGMYNKMATNLRTKLEVTKEEEIGPTTLFKLSDKTILIGQGEKSIIIFSMPDNFNFIPEL